MVNVRRLLLSVMAVGTCCGLHFPRHHTAGIRPSNLFAKASKATSTVPRTPKLTLPPKDTKITGDAVLAELIAREKLHIEHCLSDEECAVREAALLRQQLRAFVDARGWNSLMDALALRTMQTRVHGIVQRRRRLVQRAETLREEAGEHQRFLSRLERVQGRLERRMTQSPVHEQAVPDGPVMRP